jgi:hypothetical protein
MMRKRADRITFLLTLLLTLSLAFCAAPESQKTSTPSSAAKTKLQVVTAPPPAGSVTASSPASDSNQKYAGILYPEGAPSRENYDTSADERVRYALLGEAHLPSGKSVILYSESVGDEKKDHSFWVFLAVLGGQEGKARVLHRLEITDRLPLRSQADGFLEIAGRVNAYFIAPASEAVDVQVWALLSGHGGISEATDSFYSVGPEGSFHLLLDAGMTAAYGRSGWRFEEETTSLVSVSPQGEAIDIARWTRITTRSEPEQPKESCRAGQKHYIFREGRYVESASATVIATMRPLPRLAFLDSKPCAEP